MKALSTIRIGWFQKNRRYHNGNIFEKLHGAADVARIRADVNAGNAITHEGQWKLDTLLSKQKILPPVIMNLFQTYYGASANAEITSPKAVAVLDMNANMVVHLAGSRFTCSKDNDKEIL